MNPFNKLYSPMATALCNRLRVIALLLIALNVGVIGMPRAKGDQPLYGMGAREHRLMAEDAQPATGEAPFTNVSPALNPDAISAAPRIPSAGLVISASFDSSITNNPNSAAIKAAINQAIAVIQSLYSDPITVSILFRYANTEPDGTPMPPGFIAGSRFVYYLPPWNVYLNALRADAKTGNDSLANASLPSTQLSPN